MQLCIDYGKLNYAIVKDNYSLPRIKDIFDTLFGSKFFIFFDFAMGYHQVEVLPKVRDKTAISTPFGLFKYYVMPLKLGTALATFMRIMTFVYSGMLYLACLAYLDDIIIFGRSFEKHLDRLDKTLKHDENANLKLDRLSAHFVIKLFGVCRIQ